MNLKLKLYILQIFLSAILDGMGIQKIYGYGSAHISVSLKQCPSLKAFKGKVL